MAMTAMVSLAPFPASVLHAASEPGATGQSAHDQLLPDTFRQFLKFAARRLHKAPSTLRLEEIDAPLVAAFLDYIEKHQSLSARSRMQSTRSFITQASNCQLTQRRSSV
jgi:hypothetical protein